MKPNRAVIIVNSTKRFSLVCFVGFLVGGLELDDLWDSFCSILWLHENPTNSFTPTVILLEITIQFMTLLLLQDHHRQLLFSKAAILRSTFPTWQGWAATTPKLPFWSPIPAEVLLQLGRSCSKFSFLYFMATKQLTSAMCLTGDRFVFTAEKCTREDLCWATEKIQEINI